MLNGYPALNLVSTAGEEQTYETNDQRPLPRTTPQPSRVPQLTSNPSCPPTVVSFLKGPHFSYDRTSSFSASPQEYKDLLLGKGIRRNPDLYRKIKYIRYVHHTG